MSNIAIYDVGGTPQRIIQYLESVNTPDYSSRPDVLVDPDISGLTSIPIRYWKHVGGAIQSMTQAEKDSVDAGISATNISAAKTGAKDSIDAVYSYDMRAIASLLVDEINVLRQWIASFKVQVAAATTLADLKTRVAGLPATPDRTLLQAKNAYKALIDGDTLDV